MKNLLLSLALIVACTAGAQNKSAYQLYTTEGKKVTYEKMLKELAEADIVLFGELHNNPICHWLELEVARDVYAQKKEKLVLGAEMFEADDQLVMDEYLSGQIKQKHFTTEAKVWPNNETDYQPLVDFAQENKVRFIATNIPRRYANLVAREGMAGLDQLTAEQTKYIAPLPVTVDMELECYRMFLDMGMGHGSEITPEKMAQSQAMKDATMAHFTLKNWKQGNTFIHYNGTYHSDNFESIVWYLKKQNPQLKIVTISTVEQENIDSLEEENHSLGTYILTIPERMTKTY